MGKVTKLESGKGKGRNKLGNPKFDFSQEEIDEMERLEDEFTKDDFDTQSGSDTVNLDKVIRICRKASDRRGHSATIQFRAPTYYIEGCSILMRELGPVKLDSSECYRTIYLLGMKTLKRLLQEEGKDTFADELGDIILLLEQSEVIANKELVWKRWVEMVDQFRETLALYSKYPNKLKSVIQKFTDNIEKIKDEFWRKVLLKKLNKEILDFEAKDREEA